MNDIKLIIRNCLSQNDLSSLDDYLPYLTCKKCNDIMLNPMYCPESNAIYCNECDCDLPHKHSISYRLLVEFIGKIKISCKYKCTDKKFPLSTLLSHIQNCPKKELYYSSKENQNKKDEEINNIPQKPQEIQLNLEESNKYTLERIFSEFLYAIDQKKENRFIRCFNCDKAEFDNKIEYLKHIIECIKNQPKKNGKIPFEEYMKNLKIMREQSGILYSCKFTFMAQKFIHEIDISIAKVKKQNKILLEKQNELADLTKSINSDEIEETIINKDDEYQQLLKEKMELLKYKNDLKEEYNNKVEILRKKIDQRKNETIEDNQKQLKLYHYLAIEGKWVNDIIKDYINGLKGKCVKCQDEQSEKYSCILCKEKFCKIKCIKKCKRDLCQEFLCPNCAVECKLCHKVVYCGSCMKKCFYKLCMNKFCIECYERNKHQVKLPENNCTFFVCDHNKNISFCLMTTLYCETCEKRMCNECILNDKEHYSDFKLFLD